MAKALRMHTPYQLLNEKNNNINNNLTSNIYHEFKELKSQTKKILPNILTDDITIDIDEIKSSHQKLLNGLVLKQKSLDEPMEKVYLSSSCSNSLKRIAKNNTVPICENCNNIMLNCTKTNNNKSEMKSLKDWLIKILKELEILTTKTKQDVAEEHRKLNWKFSAMVIDRLCMILFAIATFISTFTFSLNLFD